MASNSLKNKKYSKDDLKNQQIRNNSQVRKDTSSGRAAGSTATSRSNRANFAGGSSPDKNSTFSLVRERSRDNRNDVQSLFSNAFNTIGINQQDTDYFSTASTAAGIGSSLYNRGVQFGDTLPGLDSALGNLQTARDAIASGNAFNDPIIAQVVSSIYGEGYDPETVKADMLAAIDQRIDLGTYASAQGRARSGDTSVRDDAGDHLAEYDRLLRLAGYDVATAAFNTPEHQQMFETYLNYTRDDLERDLDLISSYRNGQAGISPDNPDLMAAAERVSEYTGTDVMTDMERAAGSVRGPARPTSGSRSAAMSGMSDAILSQYDSGYQDLSTEYNRALAENGLTPQEKIQLAASGYDPATEGTQAFDDYMAYLKDAQLMQTQQEQLEKDIEEWQQETEHYRQLVNEPDFEELSQPMASDYDNRTGYVLMNGTDAVDVSVINAFIYKMVEASADPEAYAAFREKHGRSVDPDPLYAKYNGMGLEYMTDGERAVFFYLFNKNPRNPEEALQYLDDLSWNTQRLRQQEMLEEQRQHAEEHTIGAYAASFAQQFGNNIVGAAALPVEALGLYRPNEYDPIFDLGLKAGVSRDVAGSKWEEITPEWELFGTRISKIGFNAFTSAVDSLINRKAFQGFGPAAKYATSASMAFGAFNSAYQRNLAEGNDDTSAFIDAVVEGAFEYATEYISVEAIMSDPSTPLGFFVKNLLSEASEEMANEGLNLTYDMLVHGADNQIRQQVDHLMAMGYTPAEAQRTAWTDWLKNFAITGITGGISGGMGSSIGAITTAVNDRRTGRGIIDAENVSGLLDVAETLNLPEDVRRLVEDQRRAERALSASLPAPKAAAQAGMEQAMEEAETSQDVADAAVEAVQAQAPSVSAQAAMPEQAQLPGSDSLTQAVQQPIEQQEQQQTGTEAPAVTAEAVTAEPTAETEADQESREWMEYIESQQTQTQETAQEIEAEPVTPDANQVREAEQEAETPAAATEQIQPTETQQQENGKPPKISAAKVGRIYREVMKQLDADAQAVLSENMARYTAQLLMTNGYEGDLQGAQQLAQGILDIVSGTPSKYNLEYIYRNDAAMKTISALTARIDEVNRIGNVRQSVAEMTRMPAKPQQADTATVENEKAPVEADQAYQEEVVSAEDMSAEERQQYVQEAAQEYGAHAEGVQAMYQTDQNPVTFARQYRQAYQFGMDGRNLDVSLKSESLTGLTEDQIRHGYLLGQSARRNAQQQQAQSVGRAVGKVDDSAIRGMRLNAVQGTTVNFMSELARASGFNVRFVATSANAKGQFTEANGSYNKATRTVTIDINAGRLSVNSVNYAMLQTAGHELTHFIKDFGDANLYNAYQEFVLDHLSRRMTEAELNAKIDQEIEANRRQNRELSREEAIDEIVADASGDVLERMTERDLRDLAEQNPSLLKRIKRFFEKWISNMKNALKVAASGQKAQNAVAAQMNDVIDELSAKWMEMFKNATENARRMDAEADGTVRDQAVHETAQPGDVQFSAGNRFDNEADDVYNTDGMKWTYNILSDQEQEQLNEALHNITDRNYKAYIPTNDGEFIVGVEEAIVFTNGNYNDPTVSMIVRFDVIDPTDTVEKIMERLKNESRKGKRSQDIDRDESREIISAMLRESAGGSSLALAEFFTPVSGDAYRRSRGIGSGASGGNQIRKTSEHDSSRRYLTKHQQRYFANSQARDRYGRLMRLYHGSSVGRIEYFKTVEGHRNGLYLSTNPKVADQFAMSLDQRKKKEQPPRVSGTDLDVYYNNVVYELYANTTNPFVIDAGRRMFNMVKTPKAMAATGKYGDTVSTDGIAKWARSEGYDGVIVRNVKESYGILTDDVIVFDKNQVKFIDNDDPTGDDSALLQVRDPSQITDREILANAMDELAQNPQERGWANTYRKHLAEIEQKQGQLDEVTKHLAELRKDPKKNRDEIIREKNRQKILADQIDREDGTLLKFEATTPVREYVKRQRAEIRQASEQRVREQYQAKIAELQREKTEAVKKVREEKNESFSRQKYLERVQKDSATLREWLTHPTNKAHVPEFLRKPLGEFMESLDFSSKRSLSGGTQTQADQRMLNAMRDLHEALSKSHGMSAAEFGGYVDLTGNFLEQFTELRNDIERAMQGETAKLQELRDRLAVTKDPAKRAELEARIKGYETSLGTPVNLMTSQQLRALSEMITTLNTSIRKMNTALGSARQLTISGMSKNTIDNVDKLGQRKAQFEGIGAVGDFWNWNNTTPIYVFKRFGAGGQAIFEELQDGWDKLAMLADKVVKFTEDTYKSEEVAAWNKQIHEFNLNGQTVRMTATQLMSLYCLNRRDQGRQHLLGGGIRVAEMKSKGKTVSDAADHMLNEAVLDEMLSKLTKRQIEVADALQAYMSNECAKLGNEISMKRFGYEMFTESMYFPIEVDKNNLRRINEEQTMEQSIFRLLNLSSTKPLQQGANNALVLRDIFDVFAAHTSDMAKYNALALPVLDMIKWYNYVEKLNSNGEPYNPEKDSGQAYQTRSVQKSLEGAFGKAARRYVETFLKDLNGDTEGGRDDGMFNRMISRYKVASVAANLRVGMLQITSLPRAAYAINPKYLFSGIAKWNTSRGKISKTARDKVGIAKWKSLGFYDTSISRNMRELIKHDESTIDKVRQGSMKLAELGDSWTMGVLYGAVEAEMRDKHKELKPGSEEYNRQVNARMREIVYQTQVVDSTMTRSQFMRSKGFATLATAFMSEPTLAMNMMNDSIFEARMKSRAGEKWSPLIYTKVSRALGVWMVTSAISAAVEALFSAMRDDDEFESFWEKYSDALLGDYDDAESFGDRWTAFWAGSFGGNLNPFDDIPILKDFISAYKGETSAPMWAAAFGELGDGVNRLITVIRDGGSPAEIYGAIYKLVGGMSKSTGIAASNAMRDIVSVYNTFLADRMGWRRVQTYDDSEGKAADAMIEAMIAGDEEAIEKAYERAGIYDMDPDKIADALAKRIDEAYVSGRIDRSTADRLLTEHGGKRARDAEDMLTEADYERATGHEHGKMKSDYLSGLLTEEEVREYLTEYDGMREGEIEERLGEWNYERDTGYVYSQMKADYIDGELTEEQVMEYRMEYGGAEEGDVTTLLGKWNYERDTGLAWSDMRLDYADGVISESELRTYLSKYGGKDEEQIEETVSNYDYQITTGRTTTAPKYWRIAYAYESGGDYEAYIDEAFNQIMYGGDKRKTWKQARSSIASSVASYYKKTYLAVAGTPEGDRMLERILDVYEAIGYNRSEQRRYIAENWFEA